MNRLAGILKQIAMAIVATVVVLYVGDYALLRAKLMWPKLGAGTGTVTMLRMYAIPQKNGRVEFEMDANQPQVTVPCVHSVFPHLGNSPCWYLQRNSDKPIPVVILPFLRN
jgi:hypothetical protein